VSKCFRSFSSEGSADRSATTRGGVRGIVELEILKLIQDKLPPLIPIRSFFDLIVGTRYTF